VDQALTGPANALGRTSAVADEAAPKSKELAPMLDVREHEHGDNNIYAGKQWSKDHPLNVRVSIPLGFGRFYLTVIAGRERRKRARLALDRRQNPLDTPANAVFFAFIAVIATAGCAALFSILLAQGLELPGRLFL